MTRPLELPKYVLLMCDDAHRQLSYDVAQEMARIDHTVYLDAFEAPLAEAFRAMWDRDWHKDYTDPRSSAALLLESSDGKSEREVIQSLDAWFTKEFGPRTLGQLGAKRAAEQQAITEYIYVFHDGKLRHIEAFEHEKAIKMRDVMMYDINAYPADGNVTEIILNMEHQWEKLDA